MATMTAEALAIPGFAEPFPLDLPPELAELRDTALAAQQQPRPPLPEITVADARSWAAHTEDEDWLLWRARRTAARLAALRFDLSPGERLVGVPRFRTPTVEEQEYLDAARQTLASVPPHPGGDTGHFHPNYEKLLAVGIGGLLREINERQASPSATDEQRTFYDACRMALQGLSAFIRRAGDECAAMARRPGEDAEAWSRLAAICHRVATEPPATFHEALQLMFLTLIALWFGEDHGLTCLGRMDQTLRRFYEADRAAGRLTPREAFELISCAFIHLNRILWPGSAVAVIVGGRDRQGADVTNELTYLCLAARQATKLVYPTVGLAWHEGTPSELMDFSLELLARGRGDPAFFNDEVIAAGLRARGVREEDGRNWMNSTCVEIKVVGASNIWVTAPYFNLAQGLLDVMRGVAEGRLPEPASFADFCGHVRRHLAEVVRRGAEERDHSWRGRERWGGFPLASCVIDDCLERGRDFDRGGARYNWVENSFVGLANLVDGIIAIKRLVYEERQLSVAAFHDIVAQDFAGQESLRQRTVHALPHYGNDDDEADALAREWAEFLIETTESNVVGLAPYCPGFFCWVMHERLGAQTGATPDGRRSGWPLADGAGAAQGREKAGPTASVLSTTKWSHQRALGGLVHNAKFSPSLFKTRESRTALRRVIETYLRRGGFEIQVNVVGREILLDAQQRPEQYPDLLVRVAGYSDYFVHLNKNMQDEIIARTEHGL